MLQWQLGPDNVHLELLAFSERNNTDPYSLLVWEAVFFQNMPHVKMPRLFLEQVWRLWGRVLPAAGLRGNARLPRGHGQPEKCSTNGPNLHPHSSCDCHLPTRRHITHAKLVQTITFRLCVFIGLKCAMIASMPHVWHSVQQSTQDQGARIGKLKNKEADED